MKCLSHGGTVCIELPDRSVPSPSSISSYRLAVLIATIGKLILSAYLNHQAIQGFSKIGMPNVGSAREGMGPHQTGVGRRDV
jgi:hypothetical protein